MSASTFNSFVVKFEYLNARRGPFDTDPTDYIISQNIHRRHLTKQERAEYIIAAVKAGAEYKPRQVGEVSHGGRGKKDETKAAIVATAAEHGISKRTVERAIAKSDGKEPAVKKSTKSIAAFRQDYLDVFSALPDYDAMGREWERPCRLIAKKLDEAREIEVAADKPEAAA